MTSFARMSGYINTRVFVKQKLEIKISHAIFVTDFKPPKIHYRKICMPKLARIFTRLFKFFSHPKSQACVLPFR